MQEAGFVVGVFPGPGIGGVADASVVVHFQDIAEGVVRVLLAVAAHGLAVVGVQRKIHDVLVFGVGGVVALADLLPAFGFHRRYSAS